MLIENIFSNMRTFGESLSQVDLKCLEFKLSCYMFLMENMVTIYLVTSNIFLANQIFKKIFEIFLIQIHHRRRECIAPIIQSTRHTIQHMQNAEALLVIIRKVDSVINIDQGTQLISPNEAGAPALDKSAPASGIALTFQMDSFSKQLESFSIFLTSQIRLESATCTSLVEFCLLVNSLLASAFFLSRATKLVLLNQMVSLYSDFRSEVYSDHIRYKFHMNSTYIEQLFLTLLNFFRVDSAMLMESPNFELDHFIREALEVFFHSENLLFRRLFAKAMIRQLWHNLALALSSASVPSQPAESGTLNKLFRGCLLICKFNFISVSNNDLELKEDLRTQIEELTGMKGVLHIRQVLNSHCNASIELSFDSDDSDSDFSSESR